jgi:hypothetical protein
VLTIALSWPLPAQITTHLLSAGADPQFWMWTLAWDAHAFVNQPFTIFDANIFYPAQHSLAYSENLIGSAMLAAPIIWLTDNVVLAMNLVKLASIFLSAVGAYVLGRRAGLERWSAVLAGIVFAFAPARFLRITQFHLTTSQWVPFGLAFLYSYLHGGRKADLRWFLLFVSLQAITSGHGAVFLLVGSFMLIAWRLIRGEPVAIGRRVRDVGWPGLIVLAPAALLFVAYVSARAEVPALARTLEDYGTSRASYVASPSHFQKMVLSYAPTWLTTPPADAYLFQGYLPILLSLVAIGWSVKRANATGAARARPAWRAAGWILDAAVLALVAAGIGLAMSGITRIKIGDVVVLSLRHQWRVWMFAAVAVAIRVAISGRAPFHFMGRLKGMASAFARWWQARWHDSATPFALITIISAWLTLGPPFGLWRWVYWLPAVSFLRVPQRFVMLEMLGLAVLAGFGAERLFGRLGARGRRVAVACVCALLIGEFAAMPLSTEAFRLDPPPIDRWLNTLPKPFIIAEVPMPRSPSPAVFAAFNARYMLHSTAHFQKTVHGFSGVEPPLHSRLFLQMSRFPDDESVNGLADLGVNYIVMHTELYRGTEQADAEARMLRYADWLTLERVEGTGRVYSLRRPR